MYKNGGQGDAQRWHSFKLQRHIVTQGKLLIVIDLFSLRFITNDYWTLLCYRLTLTCVSEPRGPVLVDFHVFRNPMSQLGHHTSTFNDVYIKVKRKSLPFQEKKFYLQFSTRKDHTFKNISALSLLLINGKRNGFENSIH